MSWAYFILFATLICAINAQGKPPQGGSLDDLIHQIFTPPPDGTDTGVINPVTPNTKPSNCIQGECVPHYLCANGSIVTDGTGIIDIRLNVDEADRQCPEFFDVCCTVRSVTPIIPDVPRTDKCGQRNGNGIGFRVTGGLDNEAQFGEFPWMVAVLRTENNQVIYQCGGSLIHPSVVLTAAHCVTGKSANDFHIRAGEWDTQTNYEVFPHQDRQVDEIVIHQQFHRGGLFNDIALLFLEKPVDITENVNTICLPTQRLNFDGSRCFASGWGKDVFGKMGKYQVILKKIDLPIVPHNQCQNAMRQTRLGKNFVLDQSFICAGGEIGKDTCKGDGGSPLVCPVTGTNNQFYQAGVVAWGIGCGTETPAAYANVALFRNWIDEQLGYKNYDQMYYKS